jgi:hypothetical protein
MSIGRASSRASIWDEIYGCILPIFVSGFDAIVRHGLAISAIPKSEHDQLHFMSKLTEFRR